MSPPIRCAVLPLRGGVVTCVGSAFIDDDEVILGVGSAYNGSGQTTTAAGNVVVKPR